MANTTAYILQFTVFPNVPMELGFIFAICDCILFLRFPREPHKWGNIVTEPVWWPGAWPAGDCLSVAWLPPLVRGGAPQGGMDTGMHRLALNGENYQDLSVGFRRFILNHCNLNTYSEDTNNR